MLSLQRQRLQLQLKRCVVWECLNQYLLRLSLHAHLDPTPPHRAMSHSLSSSLLPRVNKQRLSADASGGAPPPSPLTQPTVNSIMDGDLLWRMAKGMSRAEMVSF